MRILLIGLGNELRGDDGAGAYIVRKLGHYELPGVETEVVTQLAPEWLENISQADMTILVDVRVAEPNDDGSVVLQKLYPEAVGSSVGHALHIAELISLGEHIFGKSLNVWVCSIPAYDFTLGNPLSEKCADLAEAALKKIALFLGQKNQG